MWWLIASAFLLVVTARAKVSVVPHDAYPGFEVKQLMHRGQPSNFRMLETGFSKFFTVLKNGVVMTTSDLTPLMNKPINLIVLQEIGNTTETHDLHLYVLDRKNMLTFSHSKLGDGEVPENAPPFTMVQGFPVLHASGNFPVHYKILPEIGDKPFVLMDSRTGDTGFNLTLRSSDQGVRVVTSRPLDREEKQSYTVVIHASDSDFISRSKISGRVSVIDENDNSPEFEKEIYRFVIKPTNLGASPVDAVAEWKRFSTIGKVKASDKDGDKIVYKLIAPSNLVVIVPQTGEILLTGDPQSSLEEDMEVEVLIEAHDVRIPSRTSERPAKVLLQFVTSEPILEEEHKIEKRRVTRAVRPTKKVDFTEGNGDLEGKVAFQLEKETDRETFKIKDENQWVIVEPNGAVKVKQKWDYEELGPEKTIDFWVTINNAGIGGQYYFERKYS